MTGGELYAEFQSKWNDDNFKEMLEQRKQLPVYHHKAEILDIVQNNQVVIIRGATGCGKTTQVSRSVYFINNLLAIFCAQ